jgi:uncharacterized RDD family membrane protein YckC
MTAARRPSSSVRTKVGVILITLGWFQRRSTRYRDPMGGYVAAFAEPWRRVAAATIDWALCYVAFLLVAIPLGIVQSVGAVSWREGDLGGLPGHVLFVVTQVLTVVPVVAYFGLLLPTSQTYGMRALELHVVSTKTGSAPSYLAATIRGVVATAFAASVYVTYQVATSFDEGRELDTTSSRLLDAAHVLVIVGSASALLMMFTPTRRSLIDRLFGTAVIDELEAVAPRMGPWGPLDAFDLSSRERSTARHAARLAIPDHRTTEQLAGSPGNDRGGIDGRPAS